MKRERIQLIDAVRGLAVILMVIHHFLYDLVAFLNAPEWLFTNPVFDVLHYIFAGLFILLSGVSSRFSRSNVKRGLKVAVIALVITAVTWFLEMPILFGVLHLLAFCMIFYGLTAKFWERLPAAVMPVLCIVLLIVSAWAVSNVAVESRHLWILGWTYPGFYSADYFPLFPWIFVFLLGTWLGKYIRDGRFPKWFYSFSVPFFPWVGRHALIIYVAHQPVLYGITLILGFFLQK